MTLRMWVDSHAPVGPASDRFARHRRRFWVLLGPTVMVFAACFSARVPDDIPIACASLNDCQDDTVCVLGRCVPATSTCVVVAGSIVSAAPEGGACGEDGGGICIKARCVTPTCGDGIVTAPTETCDGDEGCRADCTRCGDGNLDSMHGETCDDGSLNSDVEPGACRTTCVLAACGDGIRDPGEGCDRGIENSATTPNACRPTCALPSCGDGLRDTGEECDEGADNNDTRPNACRLTCTTSTCGDGTIDNGELCDDGRINSDVQPGTCRTDCRPARCGDGTLDVGEQCDDGTQNANLTPGACRTTCVRAACGDGVVDPLEECDDGFANSDTAADACRADCRRPICGDGTIDAGEACDEGLANSDVQPGACRTSCVAAACGDGALDPGEQCDWGSGNSNTHPNACRATCRRSRCGDRVIDSSEACDNGADNSDLLPGACRTTCVQAACGDGVVDAGEDCDDGPNNSDVLPGACRSSCATAACGDGVRDPGEACDDGPLNSDTEPDSCRTTCAPSTCGDGTLDLLEQCDDGEENSDTQADLCRTTCVLPRCGDGVMDDNETCDEGSANSDVRPGACRTTCIPSDCGDGTLDVGEECDEGEANSDDQPDACRTSCRLPACGDGVVDQGEACDDADAAGGTCSTDCTKRAVCGDGILDDGEACDDANFNPRDGCDACRRMGWVQTFILGPGVDARLAPQTPLSRPTGIALDVDDSFVVSEQLGNRLVRISDDTVTVVAGSGLPTVTGNGGAASIAGLNGPWHIAIDGTGRIAVAEPETHTIRSIDLNGVIQTVAGVGTSGFLGDSGPALRARLNRPTSVAFDGVGNLYIADAGNFRVRRVNTQGVITTVFGTGTSGSTGDGVAGTLARVSPFALAADRTRGRLYVVDTVSRNLRVLDENGLAGTVATGFVEPTSVAVARDGTVYVSDAGAHVVLRIDAQGVVTTAAGNGVPGSGGDGGQATLAQLQRPQGVAVDSLGQLYIADERGHVVRRVGVNGIIQTVAGTGVAGDMVTGEHALSVTPYRPQDTAFDREGRVLVADSNNARVVRVETDGTVRVIAGTTPGPFSHELEPALNARFGDVRSVAVDGVGRVYLADTTSHRVVRFEVDGVVATVAGTGEPGFFGDGGPAREAKLNAPTELTFDALGRLLIIDSGNVRVRRIDDQGTIDTIAGSGVTGSSGDGALATLARLNQPSDLVGRPDGSFVIADVGNQRIREVDTGGLIRTIAGTGTRATSLAADGSTASTVALSDPVSVAVDIQGRVFFAEQGFHVLRRIDADGTLRTVAGSTSAGSMSTPKSTGDGGAGTAARLAAPRGLAIAPDGAIVWADHVADRIRLMSSQGVVSTVLGNVHPDMVGTGLLGRVIGASQATMLPDGRIVVACGGPARVAVVDVTSDSSTRVRTVVGGDAASEPNGGASASLFVFGEPAGVVFTPTGSIYVSDSAGGRLLRVDVTPTDAARWTVAVLPTMGLRNPRGLFWEEAEGTLLVADAGDHCIRRVVPGVGTVEEVLGRCGTYGISDDGVQVAAARLRGPEHVLVAPDGTMYVSDTQNHRVLMVRDGFVTRVVGTGAASSAGVGVARAQSVDSPRGLALDGLGNLYIAARRAIRVIADTNGDSLASGDDLALLAMTLDEGSGAQACLTDVVFRPASAGTEDVLTVMDGCGGSIRRLRPARTP